jgi:hypothetical protein
VAATLDIVPVPSLLQSFEFMSPASVFPRTFSCPVRLCCKTCQYESARDEHIARKHKDAPQALAAFKRLDKRMLEKLRLGSISQPQATEGIKEIVPTEDSEISRSETLGAESRINVSNIETTTFEPTFACLVRSCRKTFLLECDCDVHIVDKHSKSMEAVAARSRLTNRMRGKLRLGSIPQTQATEGTKGMLANDESTTDAPVIETTTIGSWSSIKGQRSGHAVAALTVEPSVESSVRTRVQTGRWIPKTWKQSDQRFITKIVRKRLKERRRKEIIPKNRS